MPSADRMVLPRADWMLLPSVNARLCHFQSIPARTKSFAHSLNSLTHTRTFAHPHICAPTSTHTHPHLLFTRIRAHDSTTIAGDAGARRLAGERMLGRASTHLARTVAEDDYSFGAVYEYQDSCGRPTIVGSTSNVPEHQFQADILQFVRCKPPPRTSQHRSTVVRAVSYSAIALR